MKQKIVIKLPLPSGKSKSTAMKVAVSIQGVSSVSIGKENDTLEIVGEGIDSVCLTKSLRKKFCFANIISVDKVKPPKPPIPPCPPPCKCCQPPSKCCPPPSKCCQPPSKCCPTPYYPPPCYPPPPPPPCYYNSDSNCLLM